jgi:HNH endonuclease
MLMKQRAEWKCERCGHPHDTKNGFTLTVHHLDGDKWNLEWWNLAALCQRCHLRIQARVDWFQDLLDGRHAQWLADHIEGYNLWASIHDKPLLKLGETYERDYSGEWPV